MIRGRLSHRREFAPVLSLGYVFVFMLQPKYAMLGLLTTTPVHPVAEISRLSFLT